MNFYKLLLHGIILSSLPIQLFSMKYAVRFQKRLAFSRLENKKSLIDPFTILSEDIRVRVLIPLLEADNLIDTQKNQGSYAFINNQAYKEIISFYKEAGSKHTINHIVLVKVERIIPILSPIYDTDISEEQVIKRWSDYWAVFYKRK